MIFLPYILPYMYALALIGIGFVGYFKSKAKTALIPLYLGIAVILILFFESMFSFSSIMSTILILIIALLACSATVKALPNFISLVFKKMEVERPLAVVLRSITCIISILYILGQVLINY